MEGALSQRQPCRCSHRYLERATGETGGVEGGVGGTVQSSTLGAHIHTQAKRLHAKYMHTRAYIDTYIHACMHSTQIHIHACIHSTHIHT